MNQAISKVNLFNRYTIAVFLLFFVITCIGLAIGFYRYQVEIDTRLDKDIVELSGQAEIISNSLEKSQQTLSGLKQFAEHYLANPDDLYASAPVLLQDGDNFI